VADDLHTIKIKSSSHWKLKQVVAVSRESIVDFVERMVEEEARKVGVKFIYREKRGE